MRLTTEQRHLAIKAVERGIKKSLVARVFSITRKTLYKWLKRKKRLRDKRAKRRERKITLEVELAILGMRNFFRWGSARIQIV